MAIALAGHSTSLQNTTPRSSWRDGTGARPGSLPISSADYPGTRPLAGLIRNGAFVGSLQLLIKGTRPARRLRLAHRGAARAIARFQLRFKPVHRLNAFDADCAPKRPAAPPS